MYCLNQGSNWWRTGRIVSRWLPGYHLFTQSISWGVHLELAHPKSVSACRDSAPILDNLVSTVIPIPVGQTIAETLKCELRLPLQWTVNWTDSRIVLDYLRNDTLRTPLFIRNRVGVILTHTSVQDWKHVPGKENPADIASRRRWKRARREPMAKWSSIPVKVQKGVASRTNRTFPTLTQPYTCSRTTDTGWWWSRPSDCSFEPNIGMGKGAELWSSYAQTRQLADTDRDLLGRCQMSGQSCSC